MKMKKYIINALLVIGIVLCIITQHLGRFVPSMFVHIQEIVPKTKSLNISEKIFYRQSYNNCAPYSVMAVIHILNGGYPDPELLAKQTPWKIRKNLTFPLGIPQQLSDNGIKAQQYTLWSLSKTKKILWLKTQINLGNPVIVLIAIKGNIRHYVTVVGYDEKGFMLYDSYQHKSTKNPRKTIDDNKALAGNKYISYEDFLKKWHKGGYGPFFNYWAVSAHL